MIASGALLQPCRVYVFLTLLHTTGVKPDVTSCSAVIAGYVLIAVNQ